MPPQSAPAAEAPRTFRIRFSAGPLDQAAPPDPGFEAPADITVLRASLREGGGLLSSCRAGTCRACMRRLVSGEIAYVIEWPGLSAEEKAEGWFLPCVARPCSDLVIEAIPDDPSA